LQIISVFGFSIYEKKQELYFMMELMDPGAGMGGISGIYSIYIYIFPISPPTPDWADAPPRYA
jgi:hypothetical protein